MQLRKDRPLFNQMMDDPPKSLTYMDATKVRTYLECQRQFALSYVLGMRPKQESVSLVWGTAMHEGIQRILQDTDTDHQSRNALEGFDAEWCKHYQPDEIVSSQKHKTREIAERIFAAYVVNDQLWRAMDIQALEYSFILKHNLTGKIDLIYYCLLYTSPSPRDS